MAATALDIARSVAVGIGIDPPGSIAGSESPFLVLLNRGCRMLAERRASFGNTWPELHKFHTFTSQAGVEYYPLPADFVQLVDGTAWNTSAWRAAPGSLSPQEDALLRHRLISSSQYDPPYRIAYNQETGALSYKVVPAPSAGLTVAFEYISKLWAREAEGAAITLDRMTGDTNVPVFPEHLVELDLDWRVRRAQGFPWESEEAEFNLERNKVLAQTVGLRMVTLNSGEGEAVDINFRRGNWFQP